MSSSDSSQGFTVQFWGVRGSVPTPGADTVRYGGNTACVEVLLGQHRIIFDGGTGLRVLGKHLQQQDHPVTAQILFTHTHWDRIQGFPFFGPAFIPGNQFDIYGATAANGASIKQRLTDQMLRPNFFTPLQKMSATMSFHTMIAGNIMTLENGATIETVTLNSHTSALGFRITYQGKSLVYATDSNTIAAGPDPNLLYLSQGADLLIYGGAYSETVDLDVERDAAMPCDQNIEIAEKTQVKEMVLFHHNPLHDDDYLDHVEMEIHNRCPQLRLAREGMIMQLAAYPLR
ncbi:MAG: MBL fold metallo-hydrolase [Cyanobacteria bacterium P01_H01_bin.162]